VNEQKGFDLGRLVTSEDELARSRAWWSPKVYRKLPKDPYKMIWLSKETDGAQFGTFVN
jgi:hypothetical protein